MGVLPVLVVVTGDSASVSFCFSASCCGFFPKLLGTGVVALRCSVSFSYERWCFVTVSGSGWVFDDEQTLVGLSAFLLAWWLFSGGGLSTGLTALYGLSGSTGVHSPGLDSWRQQSLVLFLEQRHRRLCDPPRAAGFEPFG